MMRAVTLPGHQRGIAALTAILVVAIATMLAIELIDDQNLNFRRTENLLRREQAQQIAQGLELLAAQILEKDYEDDPDKDSLDEAWAADYSFPFEGGVVVGRLEDLQGRFNLNSLLNADGSRNDRAIERFRRLVAIAARDLEGDPVIVDSVVDATIDWIDADQLPELGGAEDGIYTARNPPYRTANFWFTTPSELQAVDGVTPQLYDRLHDLVSALPPAGAQSASSRRINVNTAKPELLQALGPDVTESVAAGWAETRDGQAWDSVEEFWDSAAQLLQPHTVPDDLEVGSRYFGLSVTVSIGTTRLAMYSLLERSSQGVVTRLRAYDAD